MAGGMRALKMTGIREPADFSEDLYIMRLIGFSNSCILQVVRVDLAVIDWRPQPRAH
jgi:hypothetical protein